MKSIYVIGSLRNPQVCLIANQLREAGYDVFDDWMAAGPEADDKWRDYEQQRGHTYAQALQGYAAKHVFAFDYFHLNCCDIAVLVYPAGRSGHLEFGYAVGRGKPGYILLDKDQERFDVMLQFATAIVYSVEDLIACLTKTSRTDDATSASISNANLRGISCSVDESYSASGVYAGIVRNQATVLSAVRHAHSTPAGTNVLPPSNLGTWRW